MHQSTRKKIVNLLTTAFEGGSNYWYDQLEVKKWPDDVPRKEIEFWHLEVPLLKGGVLVFEDKDEPVYASQNNGLGADAEGKYRLTLKDLERGWATFKEKCPEHYGDLLKEQDDSETGDCFLQCAVFGEVIYG